MPIMAISRFSVVGLIAPRKSILLGLQFAMDWEPSMELLNYLIFDLSLSLSPAEFFNSFWPSNNNPLK